MRTSNKDKIMYGIKCTRVIHLLKKIRMILLQCLHNGAKKVLFADTVKGFSIVLLDLMSGFRLVSYSDFADVIFKALGLNKTK